MASVDDNPGNDSSRKRAAARQISKDDDLDAEDEVVADGVSFKKAPDAVLANRRMVKVRRTGGTAAPAPAAANPFASIRLVPPPQPTSAEAQSEAPPEAPTEVPSEAPTEAPSEAETHEDKEKDNIAPASGENLEKNASEPATEPPSETVTETPADSATAVDGTKVSADNVANGETVVNDGVSEKVSVGPSGLSSETFQQLSSAKNAFSGSFGTGFSATSTTSGSTPGVSSIGFGSLTGGFSFASSPAFGTSLIGSGSGQAVSPFQNSVFGKTNGNSTFQLFGSGAAAATLPASGLPPSTGVSLQEVHVESGEEKEKTVFAADASLFEFLDGGWNERGKGEIKVNVPEDVNRRPRLVMRAKGNLRLLLNANILPDMKITKMDNRGVTFVCANAIGDGKVGLATYALKLRDAQIARDFLSTVEAKKGMAASAEPRTPETSPKAVGRSSDEVAKDIEAAGGQSDT